MFSIGRPRIHRPAGVLASRHVAVAAGATAGVLLGLVLAFTVSSALGGAILGVTAVIAAMTLAVRNDLDHLDRD